MRLEFLKKKLARLEAKRGKLDERCKAATELAEVRSLTDELDELNEEISEVRSEIQMIEGETEKRELPPADAQQKNGGIVASFAQPAQQGGRPQVNVAPEQSEKPARSAKPWFMFGGRDQDS